VAAAPPSPVQIDLRPTQFFPVELGTWQASGAISDSGLYRRTFGQTAPPERPFGQTGPFREVFVLDGTQGTLTIKDESLDRGDRGGVTGVWQVVSGTGAYEGASGHGTLTFDGQTLTLILTGVFKTVGPDS
jgi:hypothetical protein